MESRDHPGVHRIVVWYHMGYLETGEDAMIVAVAAERRVQAFCVAEATVEDVKVKLPIWKK